MIRATVLRLCTVILAAAGFSHAEAAEPPTLARPLPKLELHDGEAIVFLGDSITHQCLYTQYVEDYFYTRFPKLRPKFHNSGVGGDRCHDALLRFDRDVAAYKPKYVAVLLGMNDGGVQPFNPDLFKTYQADMRQLLDKIAEIGATPILITPTMFDARAARAAPISKSPRPAESIEMYNATLAYYGAWCRETAFERGAGFVDMYSLLNNHTLERRKTEPAFTMIRDGVHPDAPGQLVMAYAFLFDLQLPRVVSTIAISRLTNDPPEVRAVHATVSDTRFTDDGVAFKAVADSLPMPVPAGAEIGAKLLNFGHRLSREAIAVHGLAPGDYDLVIDGKPVGRYPAETIEHGVELQGNDKTPQHAQAVGVLDLNRKRNDEGVRPLRNLWRDQKILRLAKDRAAANPKDEMAKKQVEELEKKLSTMEEQIAALEAEAKKIEDRIYEANQPRMHEYRLVRVK